MMNCLMEAFQKIGNLLQDGEEDEKWIRDRLHKSSILLYF